MIKIKERLKEFLNTKKISKLEFYKNINVANGYLDKEGSINSDILATIITKYPELNIFWLLFGKDSIMFQSKENVRPHESSCDEKCKLKDYVIDLQKEKIKIMEAQVLNFS
jgi:hypothetical protein